MSALFKKWCEISLVLRISCGLILGSVLALAMPSWTGLSILGTMFVGALKGVAPILVFALIISSMAKSNSGIGSRFRLVICLYMFSTLFAACLAVAASMTFPVELTLVTAASNPSPEGIGQVFGNILANVATNPVHAIMNANYIGILFWSILLGIAMKAASDTTKELLSDAADAISQCVRWIINFAPFGIMGLVFDAVSQNGLDIFVDYGKLLAVLVGCMAFMALVVFPVVVFVCLHKNPFPLVFRCLHESGVTAFFTRSSAANIPVNMALCEKLGLDKDMYMVSIPLGSAINMNGAAITITVMSLAAAHTMGIAVDVPTAILLSLLATVAACGASGVAGGSLLLIPMACSLFGIGNDIAMQVVAVGFIIGVIQDSVETALNSAGDVLFTATADFMEKKSKGEKIEF